tara:strand:- start:2142 stop:3485 length:1344 start_codon:yes stop_codon:yes gene_type:complete
MFATTSTSSSLTTTETILSLSLSNRRRLRSNHHPSMMAKSSSQNHHRLKREERNTLRRKDDEKMMISEGRRQRRAKLQTTRAGGEDETIFSFPLDGPSAPEKKLVLATNSVRLKSVLKLLFVLVVCGWSMRYAHDPSTSSLTLLKRASGSVTLGFLLALIGYKKKSLDLSGAVSASLVGVLTIFSGVRYGLTLAFFFFSGSAVTKVQSEVKKQVDEHFKEGGGLRDFVQVMANGLVPTMLAAASLYSLGGLSFIANTTGAGAFAEAIISSGGSNSSMNNATTKVASTLAVAFLSYFSCCGGDTFASELGVLSKSKPRLITTFCRKEVEPGTNGGVSLLGVVASIFGGLVAASGWALGAYITSGVRTEILYALIIGAFGGFFGSFVDSVLGATVQYSGYCRERKKVVSKPGPTVTKISGLEILSNSGVNVLSASFIAVAFGALYYYRI